MNLDQHIKSTREAFQKVKEDINSIKQRLEVLEQQKHYTEPIKPIMKSEIAELTPHTRKAFTIIIKLLNELNQEWLPVANLIQEIYPNRDIEKARNSTSNILKPLIIKEFLERKRDGNYGFIKLTQKGYNTIKKEINKVQVGNISKFYE